MQGPRTSPQNIKAYDILKRATCTPSAKNLQQRNTHSVVRISRRFEEPDDFTRLRNAASRPCRGLVFLNKRKRSSFGTCLESLKEPSRDRGPRLNFKQG